MIQYILHNQDDEDLLNIMLGHSTNSQQQQHYQLFDSLQNQQINNHPNYIPLAQNQPIINLFDQENPLQSPILYSQHSLQSHNYNESSLDQQNPIFQKAQVSQIKQTTLLHKKQKNSNTIKKIGRIILDNLRQYKKINKSNTSVANMLKTLSKNSKVGRTEMNKRDKFNTYHLRQLVNGKDQELVSYNLRTTRRILSKYLRDNVMSSKQITNQNKILYLNTMKCSALRCVNKNLAVRLQMSMRQ